MEFSLIFLYFYENPDSAFSVSTVNELLNDEELLFFMNSLCRLSLYISVLFRIAVLGEIFHSIGLFQHIASLEFGIVLIEHGFNKIEQSFSVQVEEKHQKQTYIGQGQSSQNF